MGMSRGAVGRVPSGVPVMRAVRAMRRSVVVPSDGTARLIVRRSEWARFTGEVRDK
jgi:hypothetical protein